MAKLLLPLTLVYNYDEIIAIKIKIMSHVSLKSDVAKPAPLLEKNVIAHVSFFLWREPEELCCASCTIWIII